MFRQEIQNAFGQFAMIENDKEKSMENEEMNAPVRKTPKVRSSVASDTDTTATSKRSRKKIEEPIVAVEKQQLKQSTKTALLMVAAFLVGSVLTYTFTANSEPTVEVSASTFAEISTGKVPLTEKELISAVKQLGVDVYWAGPVEGAKYTLSAPAEGQVYVRYLPKGEGLTDTKPNYLVIATYATPDAFTATQAAGNQTNGVTFISTQGAAVFYSKDAPTNVYVAYPNIDIQIEVFSPIAQTALDIASKQGALRLVM
jgi:hypothetical protein